MSDNSSPPVENIASLEDFEAWMRQLSPYHKLHVPPVIAVRCALRVMPFAADFFSGSSGGASGPAWGKSAALSFFRAIFTARAAWLHPSRALGHACLNAGKAIQSHVSGKAEGGVLGYAGRAASEAAFCVVQFVSAFESNSVVADFSLHAEDAVISALRADGKSGNNEGQTEFWPAIDADRRRMESADASAAFMRAPLWPDGGPDWWHHLAESFHHTLANVHEAGADTSNWTLWSDWLQDCVSGSPAWGLPTDRTAPVEQRIALGDGRPDFWERDPAEVAADIARLIAEASSVAEAAARLEVAKATSKRTQRKVRKSAIKGSANIASGEDTLQATATLSPASEPNPAATASGPPPPAHRADLEPLSDAVDPSVDYLDRADIAFALAGRLNEVWDQMNPADPPVEPGDSASWTGYFRKGPKPSAPGFVVHIDAPWGGGKSTFAEYLAQILNPYSGEGPMPGWLKALPLGDEKSWPQRFRRPWHIVRFNAWQHQHVSPPWWVFYETVRQTCVKQSASETNLRQESELPPPMPAFGFARRGTGLERQARHWLGEWLWRLWTPAFKVSLAASLATIALILFFFKAGLVDAAALNDIKDGKLPAKPVGFLATALIVLLGGGASVWKLIASLASNLVPGTPDAAKNFSQGADDPLRRMRRHFTALMQRIHRPVLVIVDDLDRCDPAFVVELVRGMQTILTSPRVVYLLLGDRDWIEQSFTEVHKAMKGIEVGPEHRFGGRFVEKAIQFSMVLPAVTPGGRAGYVSKILNKDSRPETARPVTELPLLLDNFVFPAAQAEVGERLRAATRKALATSDFEKRETLARGILADFDFHELRLPTDLFEQEMAQKLFYLASTDSTAEKGTAHMLEGLAPVLPANPRQIKRIINTLSLLGQVLRKNDPEKRPGSTHWRALARWVVVMVEWPMTWFTLTRYPALADLATAIFAPSPNLKFETIIANGKAMGELPGGGGMALAQMIAANKSVMEILTFSGPEWPQDNITRTHIEWLAAIMPAASGQMLTAPAPVKTDAEKPETPARAKAGTAAPAPSKPTPRSPPASPAA